MVLEPIYSSSVWGAGWYNAAMSAHYADNAIRFEGSVDIELQGSDNLWNLLEDWIITGRAYPKSLDISPDGSRVYRYWTNGAYGSNYTYRGAWNTSAGFSTSDGSFVTLSLGTIALDRDEVDPAGGTDFTSYTYIATKTGVITGTCSDVFDDTNPLNPSGNNVDPIPYWRTKAELLRGTFPSTVATLFAGGAVPQSGIETVEWGVDITQNNVVLYTCNGSRLPTALLQGPMDVTGTVVLYHPNGVFDPVIGPAGGYSLTNPYLYAEVTWFRVTIERGTLDTVYIMLPAVVVESDDYGIAGQTDLSNRGFGIKGLGGRCVQSTLLPPCVMSDSAGDFVAP